MRFFIRSQGDAISAISRCDIDADDGYSALALARFHEICEEIPDNAQIIYAKGLIKRDFLGQGLAALELFRRAYELATAQKLKTNTAWFSACNAALLSRDFQEMCRWTEIALRGCPERNDLERQQYEQVLRHVNNDQDYLAFLEQKQEFPADVTVEPGHRAAILELMIYVGSDSVPLNLTLELHKRRALFLRVLDSRAEKLREPEAFPPDERLALLEAVQGMKWVTENDSFDAEAWNYLAAWFGLLEGYDEAIDAADRAIDLRPQYARPYTNKAYALYHSNRQAEALACVQESLRIAELEGSVQEIEQARALSVQYSNPPRPLTWEEMLPVIQLFLEKAKRRSDKDLARLSWSSTKRLAETIVNYAGTFRGQQGKVLVPMVAQLLGDFTPETALAVCLHMVPNHIDVAEACLGASLYLAAFSEGVTRHDAARFAILMFLVHMDLHRIRANYRQAVLEPSAAATDHFSQLATIMREHLGRLHPSLPSLIADQEHVDEFGRARAARNILSQFSGEPPTPIRIPEPGWFRKWMLKLMCYWRLMPDFIGGLV